MGFSLAFTETMLAWGLSIGSPTPPAALYVSWHTGDPGANGADESSNIARKAHAAWVLETADDGTVESDGAGVSPAATGPDTITHFGVWNALTNGNFLFGGALDAPEVITSGNTLSWADGTLKAEIT